MDHRGHGLTPPSDPIFLRVKQQIESLGFWSSKPTLSFWTSLAAWP